MGLDEVFRVLDALHEIAVQFWVEGGWGVDALVGQQTRPHRDLDVDFDAGHEAQVVEALGRLGYEVETDWRPNRVELARPGRGWVDLHPLLLSPDGSARQAALGNGFHEFPTSYFTSGSLDGHQVPCVSIEAQWAFHDGYDLRPHDLHDLEVLRSLSR
ncbi:MAG: hypothetical protein L0I24_00960 [Pseudonocardia sp.]|nr:hypothetical protein [Pseudonocardia sp.]